MSTFEEVCLLSCEKWVDTFPTEIPKHKFSKNHTERIKKIFQTEAKHSPSKKIIKYILIAAILFATVTTGFAGSPFREAVINKLFNHSEYSITDSDNIKAVKSLKLNYIPNQYKIIEECKSNSCYEEIYEYESKTFSVQKHRLSTSIGYDTERYGSENIKINGIDAVYYISDNNYKGIIFNNGYFIFSISGNIDKDTLVKIAQNVE